MIAFQQKQKLQSHLLAFSNVQLCNLNAPKALGQGRRHLFQPASALMPKPVLNQAACYGKCRLNVRSLFVSADLSLFKFITTELTRGYFLEHNEAKYTERRERVYTCLRIPKELEKVNGMAQFHKDT